MRKLLAVITTILFGATINAQIGGTSSFTFLKLPSTARTVAMGGIVNCIKDKDVALALQNPALLNPEMDGRVAMSFNSIILGIKYGYVGYAKHTKYGTFAAGGTLIDYGTFIGYDDGGNKTDDVDANENYFHLSYGNNITPKFSYGSTLKFAYSTLGPYISTAVLFDFGTAYQDTANKLCVGFVIKNAGTQLLTYGGGAKEKMPLDIQLGISKQLKYLPFRFLLVAHNLQKGDFTYKQYLQSDQIDLNGGNVNQTEATRGDKILRHFIVGGEIVSNHFSLLFGYDHQKRKELGPQIGKRVTGFSWGISLKIRKFNITYGSQQLFPGFSQNLFTLNTNINDFKKVKKTVTP